MKILKESVEANPESIIHIFNNKHKEINPDDLEVDEWYTFVPLDGSLILNDGEDYIPIYEPGVDEYNPYELDDFDVLVGDDPKSDIAKGFADFISQHLDDKDITGFGDVVLGIYDF